MRARLVFVATLFLCGALAAPAGAVELLLYGGMGEPDDAEDAAEDFKPGFGLGASVGGAVHKNLSLHAQAQYNMIELEKEPPAGVDYSAGIMLLSGVALAHLDRKGSLDVVLGPAAGMFALLSTAKQGETEASASVTGYHLGLQVGALFRLSKTATIGPLAQYSRLWATKTCVEVTQGGASDESCDDDPSNKNDPAFWSVNVALALEL